MFLRDGSMQLVQKIRVDAEAVSFQNCEVDTMLWSIKKSSVIKIRMANTGRLDFPEMPGVAFEKPVFLKKMAGPKTPPTKSIENLHHSQCQEFCGE